MAWLNPCINVLDVIFSPNDNDTLVAISTNLSSSIPSISIVANSAAIPITDAIGSNLLKE